MSDLDVWNAKRAGQNPPLHNDRPVPGYFRITRDGVDRRVAFWISNGELLGEIDDEAVDPRKLWPSVMRGQWVSYADYKFHVDTGRWPDQPAPIGHNMPPAAEEADPNPEYTRLTKEADAVLAKAKALFNDGAPSEKELADQMAALTLKMNALAVDAEHEHDVEKEPWLKGGRKTDERWSFSKHLRETAKNLTETVIKPILIRQRQKQEAEARVAREEAARIAREVRQRQLDAEAAGRPAPAEEPPPPPPPVEPVRVSAGIGRKQVALKDKEVVKVTDAKAFALYLIEKDDADLAAVLDKRANALLRAKATAGVPGITVAMEAKL